MKRRRGIGVLLCGAAVGAGALGTLAATSGADGQATPAAVTSETPSTAQTAGLTPAEIALLSSGQPVDVVMDPTTGDIESVTAASSSGVVSKITHRDAICDSGDGCYKTDQSPDANQGFYGAASELHVTPT